MGLEGENPKVCGHSKWQNLPLIQFIFPNICKNDDDVFNIN